MQAGTRVCEGSGPSGLSRLGLTGLRGLLGFFGLKGKKEMEMGRLVWGCFEMGLVFVLGSFSISNSNKV